MTLVYALFLLHSIIRAKMGFLFQCYKSNIKIIYKSKLEKLTNSRIFFSILNKKYYNI